MASTPSTLEEVRDHLRMHKHMHPTNRDFSREAWVALFEAADGSGNVLALRDFGLAIHADLEAIRQRLDEIQAAAPDGANRLQMCLAQANSLVFKVEDAKWKERSTQQESLPDLLVAKELAGVKMNLRATFDSFVEAVHDGLRLPLAYYANDAKSGRSRVVKSDYSNSFARAVNQLASLYTGLEYAWGAVVWQGLLVDRRGGEFLLHPADTRLSENLGICKHINDVEKVQAPLALWTSWRQLESAVRLTLIPPVAFVLLRKGRLTVRWSWEHRSVESPPLELVASSITEDRISRSVMKLAYPKSEVSAEDALRVRALIRQVALSIEKELAGAHEERRKSLLSATFDKGHLVEAFQVILQWPRTKVKQAIDLFTFEGARSEVWYQPLVAIDENRMSLALHPASSASLLRTMEWLLLRDRSRAGEKGHAFEDSIAEYFGAASTLNSVVAVEVRKRLATRNDIGDVDIAIEFDDILLVIECKCTMHPATPNDYFNRERLVEKAASQIVRKAEFITQHLGECVKRYKLRSRPTAVVPLVLVSGNEYVGWLAKDGVPVVSKDSLVRVVANQVDTLTRFDSDGEKVIVPPKVLYETSQQGRSILLEELASPRLIEFYRPYVKRLFAAYQSAADDGRAYHLAYHDVVFDEEDVPHYVQRIGAVDAEGIHTEGGGTSGAGV